MKIRTLRLAAFKRFDQAVTVEGFGDGLNLIAGPNETGKSTLLLAIRAALFERHGSKTQAVKDLAPHRTTGAAPNVTLGFEIDGKRYHLEKQFLKRPMARLETEGQRFEGGDAETEVKRLLGLPTSEKSPIDKDSPAHFGVMLTPQTQSFTQPSLADRTRHSLEAAIATEIDTLGSQSEVEDLLADLRGDRAVFIDGRGKPKGRYKEILERLETLDREIEDIRQKRDLLHQDVEALDQAIAAREKLASAEDGTALGERLASLEAARAGAARWRELENHRLQARHRLQQLQTERSTLERRLEARRQLAAEIVQIDQELATVADRLGLIEHGIAEREKLRADLDETRDRLASTKRHLERLGEQIERRRQIESTLSALATEVRFDLDDGALDRVAVNGEALEPSRNAIQATEGLTIEIEGIGRITIEPKTGPMQDALDARDRTETEITDLLTTLELDDADPAAIEELWQGVQADGESLDAGRADLETALSSERQQAAEAKAALASLKDRRERQTQRLAEIDATDADDTDAAARRLALDPLITDAERALKDAEEALRTFKRRDGSDASPTLDRLEIEIGSLTARIEDRRRHLDEAAKAIVRLESAIAVRAGLGLDEQIDQLERQRHLLAKERDAFKLDHEALTLLQTTLEEAAETAKATFNAPLSARLTPYIQALFPDATAVVTPDFSIRAIDRNGVEEPFLQLSDGTREQIAILARLAFADMLQEQGLPALVVLDDALAFSDNARLERMLGILEKAAARMQIIILTCREDRFAEVEATRLHIAPTSEQTSSAA